MKGSEISMDTTASRYSILLFPGISRLPSLIYRDEEEETEDDEPIRKSGFKRKHRRIGKHDRGTCPFIKNGKRCIANDCKECEIYKELI
jgi:hypothetical protein